MHAADAAGGALAGTAILGFVACIAERSGREPVGTGGGVFAGRVSGVSSVSDDFLLTLPNPDIRVLSNAFPEGGGGGSRLACDCALVVSVADGLGDLSQVFLCGSCGGGRDRVELLSVETVETLWLED